MIRPSLSWNQSSFSQGAHARLAQAGQFQNQTLQAQRSQLQAAQVANNTQVAQSSVRQPFRTPSSIAGPGQNRGVLNMGAVQMLSPSAPLARTVQRAPPVPRPIAFKRCSSCG